LDGVRVAIRGNAIAYPPLALPSTNYSYHLIPSLYPAAQTGNLPQVPDLPTICIVGPGLIGGSLALAAAAAGHPVTILCRDSAEAQSAQHLGLAHTDPAAVVPQASWTFLATPVTAFESQFRRIAPHLAPTAMVSDVGSTKRAAHTLAHQILPPSPVGSLPRFIGSHPMAGSEKKGLPHARADLFQNAPCILTSDLHTSHSPLTPRDALSDLTAFWQRLGTRVTYLDPQTHDRLLASVSHLPHLLAACLVLAQPPGAIPLAGGGFRDATRVASGDADMWTGILQANADNILTALTLVETQIQTARQLLSTADTDALRSLLQSARTARTNAP
jgi:prephenate dehydrogenase